MNPKENIVNSIAFLAHCVAWVYASNAIFIYLIGGNPTQINYSTIYQYGYYYRDIETFKNIALSIVLGASVFILFYIGVHSSGKKLFGDAKLATYFDIKKAGLFNDAGIVIGKFKNRLMMFGGGLHVLLAAPTGSGKGVSVVLPTLLTWKDSVICVDMKNENFSITSKYRAMHGQKVYFFNPLNEEYKTHRCNPLAYVSPDKNLRINDIQKIASMLFVGGKETDPIWIETPKILFLGICLYILDKGKKLSMGEVLRISLTDGDPKEFFTDAIAENDLSAECVMALNGYCSITADTTRSGVLANFRSSLSLWFNPVVDAATSDNDFDLRQVRKERMSIYLGITPDNLTRLAPLVNLFFQQVIDLNTREIPGHDKSIKHQCLLLMDEFPALGKIPSLSKGIAYIRGYNLRLMCVIQSPAQLVDLYGTAAAENFSQNHACMIVFPPKASDVKTAEEISKWLGYQTVKSKSVSGSLMPLGKNEPSVSKSDRQRALLLPQEITGMKQGKSLVVIERCPPILADMSYYYNDSIFINRLKTVSISLNKIIGNPSQKDIETAVLNDELCINVKPLSIAGQHVECAKINGHIVAWRDVYTPNADEMDYEKLTKRAIELVRQAGVKDE